MQTSVFEMSNDPTARRLLPQTSQMGSFSFAPPAYQQQPRETQKSAPSVKLLKKKKTHQSVVKVLTRCADYVFVDEHNRHKRLKGMRSPLLSSAAPQVPC